jgi:hypothetical protein
VIRLFRSISGMFRNPWMRTWMLCSALWIIGFNVWSYQRWEKMAAVSLLLINQEIEGIDKALPKEIPKDYIWQYSWNGEPDPNPPEWRPYRESLEKRRALKSDISHYENYWWWSWWLWSKSSWLCQDKNNIWYLTWCLVPIGVGLITVLGIGWIIRGFREKM